MSHPSEPIHEPVIVTQHVFEVKVETLRREIATGINTAIDMLRREIAAARSVVDERDRLYGERHQQEQINVQTALASAEKAVNAALAAAKEASFEQKESLKEYKTASNEWRDTVTELSGRLGEIGKLEQRMSGIEEKVNELRRVDSKGEGASEALSVAKRNTLIIVGLVITVGLFLIREFFLKGLNP